MHKVSLSNSSIFIYKSWQILMKYSEIPEPFKLTFLPWQISIPTILTHKEEMPCLPTHAQTHHSIFT